MSRYSVTPTDIQAIRAYLGLSQLQLSVLLGCANSSTTVSRWENGHVKPKDPVLFRLIQLAEQVENDSDKCLAQIYEDMVLKTANDLDPAHIALNGLILMCQVGSVCHGTNLGTSDTDLKGICVEPKETAFGLHHFENYRQRTAVKDECSKVGDKDIEIHSLRKFLGLILKGNPSELLPLYVSPEHIIKITPLGERLRELAPAMASKLAAERFAGYMYRQIVDMQRPVSKDREDRMELFRAHGYDTKSAYHACRLGMQGVEYLKTGKLTLPMKECDRQFLLSVRRGGYKLSELVDACQQLREDIEELRNTSPLPDRPDYDTVERFQIAAHEQFWSGGK